MRQMSKPVVYGDLFCVAEALRIYEVAKLAREEFEARGEIPKVEKVRRADGIEQTANYRSLGKLPSERDSWAESC
jgi:hypothetical protein